MSEVTSTAPERYRIEDLVLDVDGVRVLRSGEPIEVPRLSFDLFAALVRKAPGVATTQWLMDTVWPGLVVGPETVTQRVRLLRTALGDDSKTPRYIQTVRGIGYRLASTVEPVTELDSDAPVNTGGVNEKQAQVLSSGRGLRPVFNAAAAYLVAAFVILQVADIVLPQLAVPDGSMRVLLGVLTVGFAATLIVALATQAARSAKAGALPGTASRAPWIVAGTALLASIGIVGVWHLGNAQRSLRTDGATSIGIAVLPFSDLSPNADQAYFSDGVHEELLSRLAELGVFRVPSRTSVEVYRSIARNSRDIARELGVDALLEGSVRHADGRVRVTVQLIDGATDDHLWAQDYDRALSIENLFAIQRDLARQIASALNATLTDEQSQRIENPPTTSLEAYDAYLKGNYYANRYTADGLKKAMEYHERATQLDPDFPHAWSGLAFAYAFGATGYGWLDPAEAVGPAKKYAARALALDPERAKTQNLLGNIHYWFDRDWKTAERYFQRAISLDPHYVGSRVSYAYLLSSRGRHDEAIAQVLKCIEIEPRSVIAHANAAWRYINARQYNLAIERADMAIAIDPGFQDARISRAWALTLSGRLDEAWDGLQFPGAYLDVKAYVAALRGDTDRARTLLADLLHPRNGGYVPPVAVALAHIGLGEYEQAFEWLERAVEGGHRDVLLLDVWAAYDPLRNDPRFDLLLRRIGLVETVSS